MDKLENYIFYSICEKSYELFETTNYSTYRMFCISFRNNIKLNSIDNTEYDKINEIYYYLNVIYNLDYETSVSYIGRYFLEEKYIIFEVPFRLILEYFRDSFN
jgi:hypothetical protein